MELLVDILVLVVISLISAIAMGIILGERDKRKKVEQELQTTRNELKTVCQEWLQENNSVYARVAYQVYVVGRKVDHTGDGFIDGEE